MNAIDIDVIVMQLFVMKIVRTEVLVSVQTLVDAHQHGQMLPVKQVRM